MSTIFATDVNGYYFVLPQSLFKHNYRYHLKTNNQLDLKTICVWACCVFNRKMDRQASFYYIALKRSCFCYEKTLLR